MMEMFAFLVSMKILQNIWTKSESVKDKSIVEPQVQAGPTAGATSSAQQAERLGIHMPMKRCPGCKAKLVT
jgi:hypothetical protein